VITERDEDQITQCFNRELDPDEMSDLVCGLESRFVEDCMIKIKDWRRQTRS